MLVLLLAGPMVASIFVLFFIVTYYNIIMFD